MSYQLLQGDAIAMLKTLPANSVQMVCTSPPYFGLRDYGTAEWEGGDAACDHKPDVKPRTDRARNGLTGGLEYMESKDPVFRDLCGKCGARRIDRQIGLEPDPETYVAKLVEVFREVRRVLHPSGVLWCNLGDSYNGSGGSTTTTNFGKAYDGKSGSFTCQPRNVAGLKPKDLIGIPWMVAFALRADGWWLRSEIIWAKKAPMPESVTDRPTKSHEQVFLLSKQANYYYDAEAIAEASVDPHGSAKRYKSAFFVGPKHEAGGYSPDGAKHTPGMKEFNGTRNKRSVWTLGPENFPGSHFATMPTKLVEPCILAGTSAKGCCSVCGAPWERITEKGEVERHPQAGNYQPARMAATAAGQGTNGLGKSSLAMTRKKEHVGWQPTCACDAGEPVPQTVLDCFSGSGTTGAVALKHHRNYVGIDLNGSYIEMAHDRIRRSQPTLLEVMP